jgi:hypothetical protein
VDDHTQYLLANGTRNLGGTLLPGVSGAYNLGDATHRMASLFSVAADLTGVLKHSIGGADPTTVQYQANPQTIKLATAGSYADSTAGNIFHLSSWVRNTGTRPVVAIHGSAFAGGAGSTAWGMNPVAYAEHATSQVWGSEIDFGSLANGGFAIGMDIYNHGTFAHTGWYLRMVSGSSGVTCPKYGVIFAETTRDGLSCQPVWADGTLILTSGAVAAGYGIDFTSATFATAAFASTGFSVGPAGAITGLSLALTNDLALADGGTGASLVDPNADRVLFWDDSAGAMTWLAPGNSVAITTTTLDTIQDIRTSASPGFVGLTLSPAAQGVALTTSCDGSWHYGLQATTSSSAQAYHRPVILLRRSKGTTGSEAAVVNGNYLLSIEGQGYGTSYADGGRIDLLANETWSGTANGAYWSFCTTAAGATGVVERLKLDSTAGTFAVPVIATAYKVGANQVVGAQGAAVANATDAASVILRLNDLLARLRTHGLIAT